MILPRTTLTLANRQSLANLEALRQRRQRASDEISTGLRVRRPSDSPAEAGAVVRTRSDLRTLAQFRSNLQAVSEQLGSADTSLNQGGELLTRATSLASQASNFSQTAATRLSIAVEVEGLIQQMVTAANTSFGGKFLFAGRLEDVQPFVPDSNSPDGVIYVGDTGRRTAALPGGTETPVSIDGQTIFLNPDTFRGSGRAAGIIGPTTPNPPVGLGLSFSNGLNGTLSVDLPSFFVAAAAPTVPAAGNQVTVGFTSTDGLIVSSITATLAGGETATGIATALNAEVALTPALAGRITFLDEGGRLKVIESDTVGVGFTFTSSATGGLLTGLESGGAIGGLSAQEIAAALNQRVALTPSLASANVRFTAVGGEIEVDADSNFIFTAVDFPRGTGFVSGLAGQHTVGGATSANVFRSLHEFRLALLANDVPGIQAAIGNLSRGIQHLSNMQGFYGAAQRQTLTAIDSLYQFEFSNQERLSLLQDADVVRSISDLNEITINEDAALRVAAAQPGPSLFDVLA